MACRRAASRPPMRRGSGRSARRTRPAFATGAAGSSAARPRAPAGAHARAGGSRCGRDRRSRGGGLQRGGGGGGGGAPPPAGRGRARGGGGGGVAAAPGRAGGGGGRRGW